MLVITTKRFYVANIDNLYDSNLTKGRKIQFIRPFALRNSLFPLTLHYKSLIPWHTQAAHTKNELSRSTRYTTNTPEPGYPTGKSGVGTFGLYMAFPKRLSTTISTLQPTHRSYRSRRLSSSAFSDKDVGRCRMPYQILRGSRYVVSHRLENLRIVKNLFVVVAWYGCRPSDA